MLFGSQSLFIYGFSFFELIPKLTCFDSDGNSFECSKESACDASSPFQIDYQHPDTIINWITRLDIVCASPYEISLLGTTLFAGLFIGSVFVSRLGDIIGRKIVLTATVLISSLTLISIILTTNLFLLYVSIFVFGVTASPRYSIAYIYFSEIVSSQYVYLYSMISMLVDAISMVVFGIYFNLIKDMAPLLWFLCIA